MKKMKELTKSDLHRNTDLHFEYILCIESNETNAYNTAGTKNRTYPVTNHQDNVAIYNPSQTIKITLERCA